MGSAAAVDTASPCKTGRRGLRRPSSRHRATSCAPTGLRSRPAPPSYSLNDALHRALILPFLYACRATRAGARRIPTHTSPLTLAAQRHTAYATILPAFWHAACRRPSAITHLALHPLHLVACCSAPHCAPSNWLRRSRTRRTLWRDAGIGADYAMDGPHATALAPLFIRWMHGVTNIRAMTPTAPASCVCADEYWADKGRVGRRRITTADKQRAAHGLLRDAQAFPVAFPDLHPHAPAP